MSIEIETKDGRTIGQIGDKEEYFFIDNKKIPMSEIKHNKELRDKLNKQIKGININDNKE